jgi:hypothetical protein
MKGVAMTQATDSTPTEATAHTDVVAAVLTVLRRSPEPLTLSKIRAGLPAAFRTISLEELGESLDRQVAANVLWQYPKYRSPQARYWDRPEPVHFAALLETTLRDEGPLAWSELRRKLPAYARDKAEGILREQVEQGRLYRHPRIGRGGERFGVQPADPKDYLQSELAGVFQRLEGLGFGRAQLREAALELLHDEEWAPTAPSPSPRRQAPADREGVEASRSDGPPPVQRSDGESTRREERDNVTHHVTAAGEQS